MSSINISSVFHGSAMAEVRIEFGMAGLLKGFTDAGLEALAMAEVSLYFADSAWEAVEVERDDHDDEAQAYVNLVRK